MQKPTPGIRLPQDRYRERLSPSLWTLIALAVCAPMVALTFTPLNSALALVLGALTAVVLVAAAVFASPVVSVEDGMLRAGRARIPVELLGEPVALTGEQARQARGIELDPRDWHLIRGGIDGVVVVPVQDPDDPTPAWVISTRTPDRLAAVVRRARG
ncbi:DUF3093 family protein [Microbacterium sp. X-17]|uniref:DUF3093 family protein n=1 Tax=Microbacterium sp. X-17 TaxID=3144404 RepID=UPI0031F4B26B